MDSDKVLSIGRENLVLYDFSKYFTIGKIRRGVRNRIEELQDINQVLREKDKMKEDVISNLSDKLIMLSERLDAIEKANKD